MTKIPKTLLAKEKFSAYVTTLKKDSTPDSILRSAFPAGTYKIVKTNKDSVCISQVHSNEIIRNGVSAVSKAHYRVSLSKLTKTEEGNYILND